MTRGKEFKTIITMYLVAALMLFVFASCNTVPENNIPTETPKASATVSATSMPEAAATPSDDVIPDESATAGTTETPVESNDASATVTPSATQSATATVKPSATNKPSATVKPSATRKPTATNKPTATPKPTATQNKEVYQTITYEGKEYKVLMGRNGNPSLIKDYSTLPKILQAYAYPTFDIETVMMDIYKYAKTQGFTSFSNPNAPLLQSSSVGETSYPDAFVPGGSMTEELANEAFSWDSPSFYTYPGDSFYKADYTEVDGIIETREFYKSDINFLVTTMEDAGYKDFYLALWIQDYGDSSYCENDPVSNGLYNGEYTREYAMYFMYGGCTDLLEKVNI